MKKIILSFLLLLLTLFTIYSEIKIIKGSNNKKKLKDAKPIYIFLTFNKTKIYDSSIDKYIAEIKKEGFNLSKKKIINDYKDKIDKACQRRGKKWNMKLIHSKSKAKKGYLIIMNYDKLVPVPAVGYNGQATVYIYKTNNLDKPLIIFKINTFTIWGFWFPRYSFSENGVNFMDELLAFLRKCK